MQDLIPIVNDPSIYINGLVSSTTSSPSQLSITPGACRDSTNTFDIILNNSLTLDATKIGANGLDIGTFSSSSFYYLYLVFDPTNNAPVASIVSLSPNGPVMPSYHGITYGAYRLIDFVSTLATSSPIAFLPYRNYGLGTNRRKQFPFKVTVSGSTPLLTSNTGFPLSLCIPPINYGAIQLTAEFIPAAAGNYIDVNVGGVVSQSMYKYYGNSAGVINSVLISPCPVTVNGVPFIYALSGNTGNTVTMYISGYDYFV